MYNIPPTSIHKATVVYLELCIWLLKLNHQFLKIKNFPQIQASLGEQQPKLNRSSIIIWERTNGLMFLFGETNIATFLFFFRSSSHLEVNFCSLIV